MGRIVVQGQPGQIVHKTPSISKIPRAKWTGSMAQVVECLLCKHEALSSNSSPTETKGLMTPNLLTSITRPNPLAWHFEILCILQQSSFPPCFSNYILQPLHSLHFFLGSIAFLILLPSTGQLVPNFKVQLKQHLFFKPSLTPTMPADRSDHVFLCAPE
jgi:hypothetical protein